MLFNSFIFVLLFLPITVVIYHLINHRGYYTAAKLFLLGMSLWFYCYSDPENVIVLLLSIVINYLIATKLLTPQCPGKNPVSDTSSDNDVPNAPLESSSPVISGETAASLPEHSSSRKIVLALGILMNVASLLYFKYTGFFSIVMTDLIKTPVFFQAILSPLGISFFTFGQIAYLVDSYRDGISKAPSLHPSSKILKSEGSSYSFLDYALFVSFFPKISVGPIAYAKELIPQFNDSLRKEADFDNIAKGLTMFSFGLAKKVLIADTVAAMVDWGYTNPLAIDSLIALIMVLGYTVQIYFDFSGYCDMASGICLMLNLELPVNFDSPYRALSVNDFWKRWHITLTRFFRQYVYFSLGGNRKGKVRTYINIFLIFLLSGFWHGANYTFIVWGITHGVFMCLSKAFLPYTERLPKAIRFIFTFFYINLTWVFFRAYTVKDAVGVILTLFSFRFNTLDQNATFVAKVCPTEFQLVQWLLSLNDPELPKLTGMIFILLVIAFAVFASVKMKNPAERVKNFKPTKRLLAATVVLLIWSIISLSDISTFIYTNF
ncbi:MAG: MBOAT family protein [Lachnospiraceae bacterium]|nr:MBOAT family protein [Lachnospiraceae bacterium]